MHGISVLSPRAYAALTRGGRAQDGEGILQRLEEEIRRRAEEVWLTTGNADPKQNWTEAERQLVRSLGPADKMLPPSWSGLTRCSSWNGGEAELQWLRQQVVSLASFDSKAANKGGMPVAAAAAAAAAAPGAPGELHEMRRRCLEHEEALKALHRKKEAEISALKQERDAQLEAMRHAVSVAESRAVSSSTRTQSLQKELTATDQLLVDRNDHCRKVEVAMAEAQVRLREQWAQLECQQDLLAAQTASLEELEHRCDERHWRVEELMMRCAGLEAKLEANKSGAEPQGQCQSAGSEAPPAL